MIKIFMRRAWLTLLTPLALAALTPGGTRAVAGPFVPWVQYRYNSPSILGQDTSGNHHDAAVTTTQIGTGPYGLSDALIVQGNNGLIVPGDQFVGNAGITVDTWVQVSESRDQAVFYKDGQYLLRLDASGAGANLNFYIMLDGAWHQLSGPPISALSWHHIVASWDGSKALLWIDAQVSSAALPGKLTANSSNLMFGLTNPWALRGLQGRLGPIAVYAQGMNETDVRNMVYAPSAPPAPFVKYAVLDPPIARAGRTCTLIARIANEGGPEQRIEATLSLPLGVTCEGAPVQSIAELPAGGSSVLRWTVRAEAKGPRGISGDASIRLTCGGHLLTTTSTKLHFGPSAATTKLDYVPSPEPADSGRYLVGAMMCNLWKQGTCGPGWKAIVPYPEREPALGWYDESSPETTDWEIKWALDHGIDFMAPCWYRAAGNLDKPVEPIYDLWLKDGLFHSRYGSEMKFAIIWVADNSVACGVSGESDLLGNVMPYWIDKYFKRGNYLLIDGKPVVFVLDIQKLTKDLGGEANAAIAVQKMRAACVAAGFSGMVLIAGTTTGSKEDAHAGQALGFDDSFSYHWPTFSPLMPHNIAVTDENISDAQQKCWQQMAQYSLPNVLTISVGWDARPWGNPNPIWRLSPLGFERLARSAKTIMDQRPQTQLDSRMILIDNWNEFGEGHAIFPTRQNGFDYLDDIRRVFTTASDNHQDLTPQDIGIGPYDSLYRTLAGDSQADFAY